MEESLHNVVSIYNIIGPPGIVSTDVHPHSEDSGSQPSVRLARTRECAQCLVVLHKGCCWLLRC
jgi:hypothetical protein